ncbi:MAG: hypothetical protein K9L82_09990, partial [Chromatiaceae bacterium]|nr:hypothetical protein [Chromatiaceae bacterium]
MQTRRAEQLGWLLGWAGGYLWILALALVFLVRGQLAVGLSGLALAALGYGAVVQGRPWRAPRTRYWRLMLLPYLAMLAGVPWAIWGFGPDAAGLRRGGAGSALARSAHPLLAADAVALFGDARWRAL